MRHSIVITLVIFACSCLAVEALGDTSRTSRRDLGELAGELLLKSRESREEALRLAETAGWPVRGRTREGRLFELEGIVRGLPLYYTTFNNTDAAITTRTDSVQHYVGGGAGLVVGLWDGDGPRSTHQELAGRVSWGDARTQIPDDHATHVAGTMIASGVRPQARGMAPQATVRAYQWDDDLAEMADEAAAGLLVSNHSYGLIRGWVDLGEWYWFGDTAVSEVEDYEFGFYDESSRDLDELLHAAPNYLVVNSAGNDRNDAVAPGTRHRYFDVRYGTWRYSTKVRDDDGAPLGYDCLSNGMPTAKNALTIGAVKPVLSYAGPSSVEMTPYSSWGPTDDGRIKPDLCGDGWDVYSSIAESDTSYEYYYGTSMASPNVCGSLGLLQDYHRDARHGLPMRGATLKALACHTARDAGPAPGPDYAFGWGLLDAYAAYRLITEDLDDRLGRLEELTLIEDAPIEFFYECDGTEPELRVTIAWADPPGTPAAPALDPPDRMLVNDLDLRLEREGAIFEPWTLDRTNPSAPAVPGDNDVDNVEQVYIADPQAGIYIVRISNDGALRGGTQDFSLVVSGARRANTWHVFADGSGDAPTIQAAVDSASAGDQILVYPGVYREHDVVVDKAVTIKGIRGSGVTAVDAGRAGRCFVLPAGAGPLRVEGLTLRNGAAEGSDEDGCGGGLYSANSEAAIVGCVVTGSVAVSGGGVYVANGLAGFSRNAVIGNTASAEGGGIRLAGADLTVDHCVVAANVSRLSGGGLYVGGSSPGIVSCTFAYNAAADHGGGMYLEQDCSTVVENSIVAFTLTGEGAYQPSAGAPAGFACCDFFANTGGDVGGALADPLGDEGNFSADPQICGASRGEYSVGDGSPCRPEGNSCGTLIGALSDRCHTKTTWRVFADGSGDEPTIQAAVDRAAEGDTILLAPGVYGGAGNRDIDLGGKNLVVRGEGGPAATIVDCGASIGEVHWGFAYQAGEDSTSVLEGVTVRGGTILGIRCSAASPIISNCVVDSCVTNGATRGGGIYLEKSNAVIRGCTISRNKADPTGGGIYMRESVSRIEGCVIVGNAATRFGGGIGVHTSSIATINDCVVNGNLAVGDHGGGIYIMSGRATIDSCFVSGNTGSFGGGLYNGLNSFCTIRRSVLAGNTARTGGGGAYTSANMTMENCTVAGNTAASYGGGIELLNGAQNSIVRSIVAFSSASGGIYTINGVQSILCSDVVGNAGGNYLGSTPDQTGINDNFSLDPGFCDAGGAGYGLYDTSACAPAHAPCGQLVGALDVACRIAPNLTIDGVNLDADALAAGRETSVEIVVRNSGVADADTFAIDWHLNRSVPPGAGEPGDRRIVVPFLAVGDTVRWTPRAFASDTIGEWESWVVVDADARVLETDESDNADGPYLVGWLPPVEPGWPAGAVDCYTSPLLVDLDGIPSTLEVVAGCDGGNLRAWNADGSPLDGWPVAIGAETRSAPAGGDIAGGPENEVVTSCNDGVVYAFAHDGQKLWEYPGPDSPASTPALVDLDNDGKREIVVRAGSSICVLEGNGTVYPGAWPLEIEAGLFGSPAVADIDGNGSFEIAIGQLGTIDNPISRVHLLTSAGASFGGGWPAIVDTIIAEPVIGDVAGDHSDLEVVVAAWNGVIQVFDKDGALVSTSERIPGEIASSPALAHFDRSGYLDAAVTSRVPPHDGVAYYECHSSVLSDRGEIIESRKVSQTGSDLGHMPSPICVGKPVDCVSGTPDGSLHALLSNYAIFAGGFVAATPAAGDIDGDGWVEIVAPTGGDSIRCFELRTGRMPTEALWWPFYRRDAARTGACGYEPVSGVDENPGAKAPAATVIRSVFPNPFNPTTRIVFEVAARSRVTLAVYDIAGREVAVLVDRDMPPGRYEVSWNGRTASGRTAASGVYFCRLQAGNALETKKIILLR